MHFLLKEQNSELLLAVCSTETQTQRLHILSSSVYVYVHMG